MQYSNAKMAKAKTAYRAGVSVAALSAGLAIAASASAQTPAPPTTTTTSAVEEVIVTGSRIVRDGYTAPTPTTVVGIEDIQKSAPVNIANYINELPQVAATNNPRTGNAGTSAGTNGINSLNLRSLGVNRTLVLLDGQRVAPVSINGAVDVNNLPSALVQRVDVVTGGASAAYGSDAVAGVVNFILDSKFTGLKGQLSTGITSRHDDRTYGAELAFGAPFAGGRGHILASAEYSDTQGVDILDPSKRKWFQACNQLTFASSVRPQRVTACGVNARYNAQGGLITSTALQNTTFGAGGVPMPFVVGSPVDTLFMVGGNVWSEGASVALEGAQTRYALWTRASYDVTDNIQASAELSYGDSKTQGSAAYQRYPGNGSTALTMRADNPFLDPTVAARAASLGVTTFLYGASTYDLGRPVNWADRKSWRGVASLNGTFAEKWKWDAYYQYGRTDTAVELRNTTNQARFREAIDATRDATGKIVCRSTLTTPGNGCVPLNIFGIGVASPEAVRYVKGVATQDLRLEQSVLSASVSGDLFDIWAGPVSVATGAEYRRESISGTADPISIANGFFTGNFKPTVGKFNVKEVFGETIIPLAKDQAWAKSLEFNGAVRYTDYSLAGSVVTWKAGLSYVPFDDLRLRAVKSRDIRAPNVGELFQAGATQRVDVVDTSLPSRPNVSATRVSSGNTALEPEKADTTSFGVVYRPSWMPQFSASIDYYSIRINGAIATVGNQDTVDRCVAGETALCSLIVRNSAGAIVQILAQPVNVAVNKTEGIDYEASWRQNFGEASVTLRALASNVRQLYTVNGPVRTNTLGENTGSTPDWRWLASASVDYRRASLTLQARGFSDGVYDNRWTSGVEIDNNEIKGATYWQLSGNYRITGERGASGRTEAFFVIQNLFDRDPEIIAGASLSALQTNPTLYDTIGRNFRVGVRFQY